MARPVHIGEFIWPEPAPKKSWRASKTRDQWNYKTVFFGHPEVKLAVTDIWSALKRVQASQNSFGMLLLSGSGGGKTRLVQEIKRNIDRLFGRSDPERDIVPALIIGIPETCTPRGLCLAFLDQLKDPEPEKRKKRTLTDQTADLMNECGVQIVLIDNIQDVPTKRRARGIEQVSTRLRDLMDRTHCLYVLLGTEIATLVVDNESQIIKRVPYRMRINYFGITTEREKRVFIKLLLEIDQWLPLAEDNSVLLKAQSGLLFIVSEGVLDRLVMFLGMASVHAGSCGREHLTNEDFQSAFASLYGPQVENIFGPDFVLRQLRKPGEPFEKFSGLPAIEGDGRPKRATKGPESSESTESRAK